MPQGMIRPLYTPPSIDLCAQSLGFDNWSRSSHIWLLHPYPTPPNSQAGPFHHRRCQAGAPLSVNITSDPDAVNALLQILPKPTWV